MLSRRLRSAILVLSASVGLGGCASYYDPYGSGVSVGYGSGYGGYGAYGDPYYGSGYGDPYYNRYGSPYYGSGYGYGYRQPYYGWYNDYYYPGTGYYVYDRSGSRQRWSETQQRYWESRGPGVTVVKPNWSTYQPQAVTRERTVNRTIGVERPRIEQRQTVRADRQTVRSERQTARQATRDTRREARQERRESRREDEKN